MELKTIPINKIKPNKSQPRDNFDKEKINELAESILSNGLINPIIIRKEKADYIIVAGERRYMAYKILKKKEIEAFVKEYKNDIDYMVDSFIENIHRTDLNVVEKSKYLKKIKDTIKIKTNRELAKKVGMSEQNVSNLLSYFEIEKEVKGPITHSHIGETIGLEKKDRIAVIKKAQKEDIGGRTLRAFSKAVKNAPEDVKEALLNDDIDTEQAERISKLKKPEDRTRAIKEHKSIAIVEKGIERNIDREMSAKEKKVFDKQLLQVGNWILSFRNSVTEANSKIKDAIKTLLLSTKFIQVMDTKQKEKLDSELERFIAKLDEGLQLAEQIQSKI